MHTPVKQKLVLDDGSRSESDATVTHARSTDASTKPMSGAQRFHPDNDTGPRKGINATAEGKGDAIQDRREIRCKINPPTAATTGTKRKANDEDDNQFTGSGAPNAELLKRFKPYNEDAEEQSPSIAEEEAIIGVYKSDRGHKRVVTATLTETAVVMFRCRNYTSHLIPIKPSAFSQNARKSDVPWEVAYKQLTQYVELRHDVDLSTYTKFVDYIIEQTTNKHHIFKSGKDAKKYKSMDAALSFMRQATVDGTLTGADDLSATQLAILASHITDLDAQHKLELRAMSLEDSCENWVDSILKYRFYKLIEMRWRSSIDVLLALMRGRNGGRVEDATNSLGLNDKALNSLGLTMGDDGLLKYGVIAEEPNTNGNG